jgi:hypothetical protein
MVILNHRLNQNGKEFYFNKIKFRLFLFDRIIPNIVKNATGELSKSVLASLVFLKEDQPDEDSRLNLSNNRNRKYISLSF